MELAENGTENVGTVQLPEDDQGLVVGQFAAFYEGHVCVGSGVILESSNDSGSSCYGSFKLAYSETTNLANASLFTDADDADDVVGFFFALSLPIGR
ncbi:hypothetical protein Tco_0213397 [Tanacetum coccineum]